MIVLVYITVFTGDILADPSIADTLHQLFEANPAAIITYTYSLDGNYDWHRRITFGRWFTQWGDGFARISHNDKASRLYVAAIFRDVTIGQIRNRSKFSQSVSRKRVLARFH